MKLDHLKLNRELKYSVIDHPFFKGIKERNLNHDSVLQFVGQYWHPISFFPTFLASLVASAPDIKLKALISKILYQETGEGSPARAHEVLYLSTLADAGFQAQKVISTPPTPGTAALMEGYHRGTRDFHGGLGFLYGTEMIDLAIVSGLGEAIHCVSKKKKLPWVDIHIEQEPDHVECSDEAVAFHFTEKEEQALVIAIHDSWRLWSSFFDELHKITRISKAG